MGCANNHKVFCQGAILFACVKWHTSDSSIRTFVSVGSQPLGGQTLRILYRFKVTQICMYPCVAELQLQMAN